MREDLQNIFDELEDLENSNKNQALNIRQLQDEINDLKNDLANASRLTIFPPSRLDINRPLPIATVSIPACVTLEVTRKHNDYHVILTDVKKGTLICQYFCTNEFNLSEVWGYIAAVFRPQIELYLKEIK